MLSAGAAALGAIARREEVRSPDGRLALAKELSWQQPAAVLEASVASAAASAPTHVVCRGRAHRVGPTGLRLSVENGQVDPAQLEGGDFVLSPREGRVLLEALGDRSARVNGVAVRPPVALEIGDRLALEGASGELWLIEIADDGA